MITKILVFGEPKASARGDLVWNRASIDGGPVQDIKITVRRFLHDGNPLEVYIDGAEPLYTTIVYAGSRIEGVDFGKAAKA